MMLNDLQTKIFNLLKPYNVWLDEIPKDFDFTKGIGRYFTIDGISDEGYCEDYPLEINLVGIKNKKMEVQALATDIEKLVSEYSDLRIFKQNAFVNSLYDDEGKFILNMKFWIRVI